MALATYGRFLASLVQWAAVTIVCLETSIPPHQNSLRLLPCKKMATIHGCSPSKVVLPPTIRPWGIFAAPHSVIVFMQFFYSFTHCLTGKSLSEALIFALTNPKYDKRFFIEFRVQYMKITSSEHLVHINCSECQNKKQFMYTACSELVIIYWTRNSMNNLLWYCGLVDASAEKNLPVLKLNSTYLVEN